MSAETIIKGADKVRETHQEVNPLAVEVNRFKLWAKGWTERSLDLEGASDSATKNNITNWLIELDEEFRIHMVRIGASGGFLGYYMTNAANQAVMDLNKLKASYLDKYASEVRTLLSPDMTKARMLAINLQNTFGKDYKKFYAQIDSYTLRLTQTQELTTTQIRSKILEQPFFKQTINLVDSAGRKWTPESYVQMYSKTRANEIDSIITLEEMTDLEMDIIEISNHGTTTPICKQFEGKFYSRFGLTPGLPRLRFMPPFHPGCLHFPMVRKDLGRENMRRINQEQNESIKAEQSSLTASDKTQIRKQESYMKNVRGF